MLNVDYGSSLHVGIYQVDPQFKKHVPKWQTFFLIQMFSAFVVFTLREEGDWHNTWMQCVSIFF